MKLRLPRPSLALAREMLAFWGSERRTLRQGFTALAISTAVGMAAGMVLGFMEELLAVLPGLLVLVPAAIGMRGAIFGALGARLGTGILTGQFEREITPGGFAHQNLVASALLTFSSSALAAIAARLIAAVFGLASISVWQLMIVSMLGGVLSSAFILVGVVFLARTAQSRNWDMDAIGSPIITATGDIVTLPALVLATFAITRVEWLNATLGIALVAVAIAAVVTGYRSPGPLTRRVVRESLPVLSYAAVVDILAGAVLEVQVESLLAEPALLILIPPFIANCGSLGGILSARLGSDLHLGLISTRRFPERRANLEGSITVLFSMAAFTGVGLIAHVAATVSGFASPGLQTMVGITLTGGLLAFVMLFFVAYYAATATYRFGLDPDNHGIPIVTATMDFFGVLCLVAGMYLFGVI
ncbi:MAG: magnesium transporter [Euzebyales bacterium]|nr:magnesium transporter [Euzebyales bacterium]